ncbi:MAG: pitrilysin family protein [Acidimicrobiia bacterium]
MSFYDLTTLPNGLRVITEEMPGIRSAAIGVWLDTGTRDEQENEAGASHFLEHLLFKGSDRLSARQISEAFDAMGAQSNAFTTKEYTCFWVRCLDEDLDRSLHLLGEMLQRPAFRDVDIDSERQVVIEEILMSEDDPEDSAFETFSQAAFAGHALERPVLGTIGSIEAMTRDDLGGYWKRRYTTGSAVVAVVSALPHERVVETVAAEFDEWGGDPVDHDHGPHRTESGLRVVTKDTEQAHLLLGAELFARGDDRRWSFELLNHVLGGGMSSRLFQSIREERGLAYSVYSFGMPFADAGVWGVYAGTHPRHLTEVAALIDAELAGVAARGIETVELERAKGSVRGSLALALEDANSRMARLGRQTVTGAELLSTGERMARIDAVTADDVRDLACEILTRPRVATVLGPVDEAAVRSMPGVG